jgi:hypothetical protein
MKNATYDLFIRLFNSVSSEALTFRWLRQDCILIVIQEVIAHHVNWYERLWKLSTNMTGFSILSIYRQLLLLQSALYCLYFVPDSQKERSYQLAFQVVSCLRYYQYLEP